MATTLPRKHYLQKGICANCKCRELKNGRLTCEVCLGASNSWRKFNRESVNTRNKKRYDTLKQHGLCVTCKVPTGENVYCRTCTTKIVANRAHKRPLHSRNRWVKR